MRPALTPHRPTAGMFAVGMFALCAAATTAVAGWWAIPVLAAVWTRMLPRTTANAITCGLGAASGWALLLVWDAAHGPVGTVARRVGGVFQLPGWGFVGVTLLFAALLAGMASAAVRRDRV
jgi:hypothetical protein